MVEPFRNAVTTFTFATAAGSNAKLEAPAPKVVDCRICCGRPVMIRGVAGWHLHCEGCARHGMLIATKSFASMEEAAATWNSEELAQTNGMTGHRALAPREHPRHAMEEPSGVTLSGERTSATVQHLRVHASAIDALRAWYKKRDTANTVALYDAAAALFGSDFNQAEYHEVE
ncbi:hypothetical protein ACRQ5Q_11890 [Bradyrhizobium sp. PMVTL-01]|uniref:hypothetical protein n=1 Tax=Bradyrhizobium sp. PMVTL-01 TaxID=3434999 RepID=UPI003F712D59